MYFSIQIRFWGFKCEEKHSVSKSIMESYWTRGQSETTALIELIQSGD